MTLTNISKHPKKLITLLTSRNEDTNRPGVLESLNHLPQIDIQARVTDLLRCGCPLDINAECVAYQRLGAIHADAAEEEHQERQPLEGFDVGAPEGFILHLSRSMAKATPEMPLKTITSDHQMPNDGR